MLLFLSLSYRFLLSSPSFKTDSGLVKHMVSLKRTDRIEMHILRETIQLEAASNVETVFIEFKINK